MIVVFFVKSRDVIIVPYLKMDLRVNLNCKNLLRKEKEQHISTKKVDRRKNRWSLFDWMNAPSNVTSLVYNHQQPETPLCVQVFRGGGVGSF
jgi:hypothetical protein